MKKVKKILISTTMIIVLFYIFMGFSGCENHSLIPNGKYILSQDKNVFILKKDAVNIDYYWEINNGWAQRCVSGTIDYKSKIIKESGILYFEGYTWTNIFSGKKLGSTTKYIVEYDNQSKSITLLVL
ncbi:MAG: hypothetical protein IKA54_04460 [Clostridia bacterium]|nr:hypothetical protein [Clostridia bacterium]